MYVRGQNVKNAKQNVDSNSYIRVSSRISVQRQCFGIKETLETVHCVINRKIDAWNCSASTLASYRVNTLSQEVSLYL